MAVRWLTIDEVAQVAYQAGLQDREKLATAVAITKPEAGMSAPQGKWANAGAHNPDSSTGDNSYGLWQINMLGNLGPARRRDFGIASNEELWDPLTNARAMVKVSGGGGNWRPWTTYVAGKHEAYMDAAYAAADRQLGNPDSVFSGGDATITLGGGDEDEDEWTGPFSTLIPHDSLRARFDPVLVDPLKPGNSPAINTEMPPGLGASYEARQFYLAGKTLEHDVREALTDATLKWSMTGVPTVQWTLRDPHRKLVKSAAFTERNTTHVDGVAFELTSVRKAGSQLVINFDHVAVAILRDNDVPRKVAANTVTRSQFISAMVVEEPFLAYFPAEGVDVQKARVELMRGDPDPVKRLMDDDKEDSWEAMKRLADEVAWRCWVLGKNEIHYAPDSWLLARPVVVTLREGQNGVDDIDFEYDRAKKVSKLTVTFRPGKVGVVPGQVVEVPDMGVASGKWLVESYERNLFRKNAKLVLVKEQPEIPEPAHEKDWDRDGGALDDALGSIFGDEGGSGDTGFVMPASGLERVDAMIEFALSQVGDRYVLGGNGPDEWDCSGFVLGCLRHVGITGYPRVSGDIANFLHNTGIKSLTMEQAAKVKGAILYQPKQGPQDEYAHVAFSLGDTMHTVEAMGTRYGVVRGPIYTVQQGSHRAYRFEVGFLVPGLHVQLPTGNRI